MRTPLAQRAFFLAAAPLFLIIFIDGMGLGLVFPLLSALIIDPNSGFINAATSPNLRNLIFGSIVGTFMFCWFFGAAFLGDLSDQIGRKKSLLICLLGAALGYLVSAVGVVMSSVSLLLIGRMVAGFTSGSQSIAQATIIDISSPEHKTRNIGLVLFAASLGFIVGPLAGGLFSDTHLVHWFNLSTPLYFAAFISLVNSLLLWVLFHETFSPKEKMTLKLHRAIEIFISAFQNPKVRRLSIILFVMIFGWSGYYSFISMFMLKKYATSPLNISIFMTLLSIGFGLGTGFLDFFTKRFALKTCITWGLIATSLFVLITAIAPQAFYAWYCVIPIGAMIALAYSALLSLFSNQVDANSQGWVMGITGSILAFAFGLNAFMLGILADLSFNLPLIIAATSLGISGVAMYFYRKGS